ncbi:uncharacterized protein LOC131989023 [Centropristis striata]|uniref:uncharacterized protein LOC131989023 n=1 Tax=Centropristis striata TaxID=184440 RepID=UPI0027E0D653|nr:uncharacterized protein LOC131989023 [Centropristis striata]
MMNFALITALLCSFSLISVCVCELHTVEVQPGEDVKLTCSNFTGTVTHIYWYRLTERSNISSISSMTTADSNASFQDGFRNGKFNMTSNITTLFLKIQQVDLSDSGLYFCGLYNGGKLYIDRATYLKVQEAVVGIKNLVNVILGAVIIFLITVIIGLFFKIRNLYTAHKEEPNPQESENLGSGDLNYAALSFHPKAKGSRRPASERELEPNVVYAATR